uniref:Immunodominant surface protein gp36 n=1 Tax=Ehrlichia canis TaxID=944 RepID=Q1AFY4_EHRCA|nr:immunodominant surface protein gp36 [Ehrlichia canis]
MLFILMGYCMLHLTTEITNIDFAHDFHIHQGERFGVSSGDLELDIENHPGHGYHILFKNNGHVISDLHGVKAEDFNFNMKDHSLNASFLIDPMAPFHELDVNNHPNFFISMHAYQDGCDNCVHGNPSRPAIVNQAQVLLPSGVTEDSVSAPATEDSVSAPATEDSVSAPATEDSVSAPATEDSVSAPATEDSVSAPATEDSVSAPATEDSVSAPATEDSVSAPATEDSVSAPATEDSVSAPATEDSVSAPATEDSVSAPATEDSVSAPATEDSVSAPATEDSVSAPATAATGSTTSYNHNTGLEFLDLGSDILNMLY